MVVVTKLVRPVSPSS